MGSRAAAIRARDGSELPVRLGRWCATIPTNGTYQEGLPLETGIPGFRDSAIPVSGRTREDTIYSSITRYRLKEPVSVLGSCTGMSEFDVILGMDWLTAYKVVINCERRRFTAYMQDGTRVVFQGDKHDTFPQTVYESKCQGQLVSWLASLTLEDEVRSDLDLPGVVYEYGDFFLDELPGLPP